MAKVTLFSRRCWLRACLKMRRGPVLRAQAGWRGATSEHTPRGSVSEEQQSQAACACKTLRAAVLLASAFVGSVVTARCGDAPTSPPRQPPKSLAAGPLPFFRQALSFAVVVTAFVATLPVFAKPLQFKGVMELTFPLDAAGHFKTNRLNFVVQSEDFQWNIHVRPVVADHSLSSENIDASFDGSTLYFVSTLNANDAAARFAARIVDTNYTGGDWWIPDGKSKRQPGAIWPTAETYASKELVPGLDRRDVLTALWRAFCSQRLLEMYPQMETALTNTTFKVTERFVGKWRGEPKVCEFRVMHSRCDEFQVHSQGLFRLRVSKVSELNGPIARVKLPARARYMERRFAEVLPGMMWTYNLPDWPEEKAVRKLEEFDRAVWASVDRRKALARQTPLSPPEE